jgi:hypothetical protein
MVCAMVGTDGVCSYAKVPGGAFYFPRRVPSDLVDQVGKKVIVASLKTASPIKVQLNAKRLCKALDADWEQLRRP